MTNKHVTDIDIQQYVLLRGNCDKDIVEHIQHCENCQTKVVQYQFLFEGIEQQETPVFDFNLADLVMQQLPQPKPTTSFDNAFIYFISLLVILLGGTVFYFFSKYLPGPLPAIAPMLSYLIFTAVICLLVFLGIDMYTKYQKQMKALNFY